MHLYSKRAVVALAAMIALAEYAEIARAEGASVFARCANQVGAQYKGEGRWQLYGTGHGLAQEQNFYNCIDAHTTGQASSSEPAVSRHHVPVKRHAAQAPPKRSFEEIHADRS